MIKMTTDIQQAVKRENVKLIRDTSRVIARTLIPEDISFIKRIIDRVLRLSEIEAQELIEQIKLGYKNRHKDLAGILQSHFNQVSKYIPPSMPITSTQRMLVGAYFTMEYSIESAALFNPSIVPHPDQSNLAEGSLRFILSLRATGEGHISSLVFRSGVVDINNSISIDEKSKYAETPEIRRDVLIGESDYTFQFRPDQDISERVIFPVLKNESIEDARFVRFVDENGDVTYYATYTAFDRFTILPQLIRTKDFLTFNIITLKGRAIQDKGMALFPRKINGKYFMLSRQDGENNRIMVSESIHLWDKTEILQEPIDTWEFNKIGNCGSPIETSKGWLVLTHGVGPMRQYSIGAILLDLANPKKIVARLEKPLLMANKEEREGYVPNVVYSCGSLIHRNTLIIPYGMSDITSGIAIVDVNELINCMKLLNNS